MTVNNVSYRDLTYLAYCVTGAQINRANGWHELGSELMVNGAFMGAIGGGGWLFSNYGNYGNALKELALKQQKFTRIRHASPNMFPAAPNSLPYPALLNLQKTLNFKELSAEEFAKLSEKEKIKYNNAKKAAEINKNLKAKVKETIKSADKAVKGGKKLSLAGRMREIEGLQQKAAADIHAAKVSGDIKPVSQAGKAARAVKNATGLSKASQAVKNSAKVSKVLKCCKGNAAFAVIAGGMELATNVIPTYKELGTEKGNKQLVKSTVKFGAEIGGFAAGAKAGAAVGASFGPIGIAAGGLIGGLIGGFIARKAANAVCGKDELVKARESVAKEMANEAKNDTDAQAKLALAAKKKIEADSIASEEDAKDILKSYNNVVEKLEKNITVDETESSESDRTSVSTTAKSSPDKGLNTLNALAGGISSGSNYWNLGNIGLNFAGTGGLSGFGGIGLSSAGTGLWNLNPNNFFGNFPGGFNTFTYGLNNPFNMYTNLYYAA